MSNELSGRRVLVIGASSGVGREIGLQAAAAGARVAFAARRAELVEEAATEAGDGSVGVVCDVRDSASCADVVARTVAQLGGLDHLVYSTAIDLLTKLTTATPAQWADSFSTNVTGAALVTSAALEHLQAAGGRAVYISASSVDRPLPGMGVYASSKAALETMVRAWQAEHPEVCFALARIGSAMPTGVYAAWDRELLTELSPRWHALGYTHDNGPGGPMTVEQAAASVVGVLTSPVWLREVTAVSHPAAASAVPG